MSCVDVIIPCYNYGRFLRDCVRSVASQTCVQVRILIIDDASRDDSAVVGSQLAADDDRIEFRRHSTNCGHLATYNEGLAWARSEFVLLLSADDLLSAGALSRATAVMRSCPAMVLAFGGQIQFNEEVPSVDTSSLKSLFQKVESISLIERMCRTGANPVNTPTAVVRTEMLDAVGGYNARLPHTADMELWLRLAMVGEVAELAAVQAFKRAHAENMQLQYVNSVLPDLQHRKSAFDVFFTGQGGQLDKRDCLWWQAHQALAEQAFWAAHTAFEQRNTDGCNQLLRFAVECDPDLPLQSNWSRLRWKQRIGPRIWQAMWPFVQWWRTAGHPARAN